MRSIRYAAVISLAATVEWISNFMNSHTPNRITIPNRKNKSVHVLETFVMRANFSKENNIETLDKIIKMRTA
jgi:hypothetical protein